MKPEISIVAACFNEEKNLAAFCQEVSKVMKKLRKVYEIIVVDDGSTDKSFSVLLRLKKKYKRLRIVKLRRNFGQSAATWAGFQNAQGKLIVTLDTDLQQDPADIPKLLKKIKEGYDVVSGWRYQRRDSFIYQLIAKIGYRLRKSLIGLDFHDVGCIPNAYKKEALKDLELYGEMHRFLVPVLAWKGYKVAEVKVSHRKRKFGRSKYNPSKALRGFLDLIVIKFWQDYSSKPIHIFGTIGLFLLTVGFPIGLWEAFRKIVLRQSIINRTTPLFAVFLVIVGTQFLVLGILADVMIRNYYKDKPTFYVEKII